MSEALFAKWKAEDLIKSALFKADRIARGLSALVPRKGARSRRDAGLNGAIKSRTLTEQQAMEVLTSGEPTHALARRYKVFRVAVEDVRARRSWFHLMPPEGIVQPVKRMRVTSKMVLAILADVGSNVAVAARHGVSDATVSTLRKKHREAIKSQEVNQTIN